MAGDLTPRRFLSILTKGLAAEMLAPTYAELRDVDLNEAAERCDAASRHLPLLEGLQRETWTALAAARANLDDERLLDKVSDKLAKNKRWQPIKKKRSDEGPLYAVVVQIDSAAGVSSGEAYSLLESPEGHRLLERGIAVLGAHFAKELLR